MHKEISKDRIKAIIALVEQDGITRASLIARALHCDEKFVRECAKIIWPFSMHEASQWARWEGI